MDITPYVDRLRHELLTAADVGGEQMRDVIDRLHSSLESSVRLMLLEALSAAADEITRELAPGSVELRLRSGEPEFVVAPPPPDEPAETVTPPGPATSLEEDDSATARINLRLPESLKAGVDEAASRERLSTNAWLVRLIATAMASPARGVGPRQGSGRVGQTYTGWVR